MKNREFHLHRRVPASRGSDHRARLRHQEVRPDREGRDGPEDRRGLDRSRGQPEADRGARREAGHDRLAHLPARQPVQGRRGGDRRGQDHDQGQPGHDGHAEERRRQVRVRQRRARPRGQEHPRRLRPEARHREQGRLHRDPGPHRQHGHGRGQSGPRPEAGRGGHDVPLQAVPHPALPHVRRQPGQLDARSPTTGRARAAPRTGGSRSSFTNKTEKGAPTNGGRAGLVRPPVVTSRWLRPPFPRGRTR